MSSPQPHNNHPPSLADEFEILDREFASLFGSIPGDGITTLSSEDEEMALLEQELQQLSGLMDRPTEVQADAIDRQQVLTTLTQTLQESLEIASIAYLSENPESVIPPLSEEQMHYLQTLANEIRDLLDQLSS